MFSIRYRNRIRESVLQMAVADRRVVAGAVVGSMALDQSDLDLAAKVEPQLRHLTVAWER